MSRVSICRGSNVALDKTFTSDIVVRGLNLSGLLDGQVEWPLRER